MPYLNFDSFQMYYQQIPGCMPADTLLIHGNFASNRWWDLCREVWVERYGSSSHPGDLILAEWRGCGRSRPLNPPDYVDFDQLADDYLALLDHCEKPRVHVIGHSTGGLIAMFAMIKTPQRFDKAVLLDPVSARGLPFEQSTQDRFLGMIEDRTVCAEVMAAVFGKVDGRRPFFQDLVDDAFSIHPYVPRHLLDALHNVDITAAIGELPHQILILHGEDDIVLNPEGSVELAQCFEKGKCEKIPACGHSCILECPRYVVNRVDKFLFTPTSSGQQPKGDPT